MNISYELCTNNGQVEGNDTDLIRAMPNLATALQSMTVDRGGILVASTDLPWGDRQRLVVVKIYFEELAGKTVAEVEQLIKTRIDKQIGRV